MPENSTSLQTVPAVTDSVIAASAASINLLGDSTQQTLPESTPPVSDWKVGTFVGRYRLSSLLGRGGFGEVWRAYDNDLDLHVAIKLPRRRHQTDSKIAQFVSEARLAAALQDPGFVAIKDVGTYQGVPYIVSELIEGLTLQVLMQQRRYSPIEAARLVAKVARTLHLAHFASLVHRDIKPANIMLKADGSIVIMDFGLAASESDQLHEVNAVLGTYQYMSPEQAGGMSTQLDGRSDIYSLGVIFYELLTGRLPYLADTYETLRAQIQEKEARPLRAIDDTIAPELERICMKCLRKQVADRYAIATDLAVDLEQFCELPTPAAATDQRDSNGNSRSVSRREFAATGITAAAMAGAWYLWHTLTTNGIKESKPGVEIPLLATRYETIIWQPIPPDDLISHDREGHSLHVRSARNNWLLHTQKSGSGNFRARMRVDISNWVGAVGFAWGIHLDPDSFFQKQYKWTEIHIERACDMFPLELTLRRMSAVLEGTTYRQDHDDPIASCQFDVPTQNAPLEIEYQPYKVGVALGDRKHQFQLSDFDLIPDLEGFYGFSGRGSVVSIQQASLVHVPLKG